MKQEDFDRLVGLIYESAIDPGVWREAMNDLSRQVGADTFHLLGWDSGNAGNHPGGDFGSRPA